MGKLRTIFLKIKKHRALGVALSAFLVVALLASGLYVYSNKSRNTQNAQQSSFVDYLRAGATDEQKAKLVIEDSRQLIAKKKYDQALELLEGANTEKFSEEEKLLVLSQKAASYGGLGEVENIKLTADEIIDSGFVKDPDLLKKWEDVRQKAEQGVNAYDQLFKNLGDER